MPPSKSLALAAALFLAACAPVKAATPVVAVSPVASASSQPPPIASTADETPVPQTVGQCVGSLPKPVPKTHRDFPAPPKATCCYPDKEGIKRLVQAKYPAMRKCYERALTKSSPGLQGRVSVKFTIGADGSVPQACDSGSDLQNTEMIDCVLRAFLDLRFPQEPGDFCPSPTTIVYPIVFQPE